MFKNVSHNSSLPIRFLAWMQERFPFENAILFFVLYLTAVALGRTFMQVEGDLFIPLDIIGCFASWSFFLLLRIYDEHKDYEIDCKNYPERVLQRGLITLKHLKIVGAVCILFQLIYCLYLDQGVGVVTYTWLFITGYSALMTVEFFMHEWLSKRLVIYALSHMVIMPMIIYWFVALGVKSSPFVQQINLFAALSFLCGFSFEITRKTRGPEEERDSVDSYSKIMGIKGCVALITLLLLGIGYLGNELVLLSSKEAFFGHYIFMGSILMAIFHLGYFMLNPSLKGRQRNEALVGLAMLSVYSVIIWSLVRG